MPPPILPRVKRPNLIKRATRKILVWVVGLRRRNVETSLMIFRPNEVNHEGFEKLDTSEFHIGGFTPIFGNIHLPEIYPIGIVKSPQYLTHQNVKADRFNRITEALLTHHCPFLLRVPAYHPWNPGLVQSAIWRVNDHRISITKARIPSPT